MRSNYKNLGRTLAAAVVATGLAGCATTNEKPDFYPQKDWENTTTYADKSGKEVVVYDLRGKWETEYYNAREVVIIEQDGNRFKGFKTMGSQYVGAKELTISGEVKGNLVDCGTHWQDGNITYLVSKISEEGNEFECEGSSRRTFKRIE